MIIHESNRINKYKNPSDNFKLLYHDKITHLANWKLSDGKMPYVCEIISSYNDYGNRIDNNVKTFYGYFYFYCDVFNGAYDAISSILIKTEYIVNTPSIFYGKISRLSSDNSIFFKNIENVYKGKEFYNRQYKKDFYSKKNKKKSVCAYDAQEFDDTFDDIFYVKNIMT